MNDNTRKRLTVTAIIALGTALLLAGRLAFGPPGCDDLPLFLVAGTALDCEARP